MDVFTRWAKTDRFFQRIMYGDDINRTNIYVIGLQIYHR